MAPGPGLQPEITHNQIDHDQALVESPGSVLLQPIRISLHSSISINKTSRTQSTINGDFKTFQAIITSLTIWHVRQSLHHMKNMSEELNNEVMFSRSDSPLV